mmetsp:Transcript_8124/g.18114  ORF Transcript_8124/g.18114 Transcript_8124/m.18114 type:complete len:210 (-) Transcript_8124:139-768(-)
MAKLLRVAAFALCLAAWGANALSLHAGESASAGSQLRGGSSDGAMAEGERLSSALLFSSLFNATEQPPLFSGRGNLTMFARIEQQAVYELHQGLSAGPVPEKSKTVLSLIFFFGLGLLGIDRCYMGQIFLGCLKGVTGGGLFFWYVIDSIIIMVNCLAKWESIDALGFRATFPKSEVESAFWIALAGLVVHVILQVCSGREAKAQSEKS